MPCRQYYRSQSIRRFQACSLAHSYILVLQSCWYCNSFCQILFILLIFQASVAVLSLSLTASLSQQPTSFLQTSLQSPQRRPNSSLPLSHRLQLSLNSLLSTASCMSNQSLSFSISSQHRCSLSARCLIELSACMFYWMASLWLSSLRLSCCLRLRDLSCYVSRLARRVWSYCCVLQIYSQRVFRRDCYTNSYQDFCDSWLYKSIMLYCSSQRAVLNLEVSTADPFCSDYISSSSNLLSDYHRCSKSCNSSLRYSSCRSSSCSLRLHDSIVYLSLEEARSMASCSSLAWARVVSRLRVSMQLARYCFYFTNCSTRPLKNNNYLLSLCSVLIY